MAHMNQEKKAKVAALVKPLLKKYGIKATLAVRNHMTLALNIKSGKIDFLGNYVDTVRKLPGRTPNEDSLALMIRSGYLDVNTYWYHEHFSGVAKKFLEEVLMAMKGADWYDRSDIQSDYFDTAYYVDINIGQWNKPYQVI